MNDSTNSYLDKRVCIVLVNYNGYKDTIECIQSLLKLEYTNFQIIIIDNNSPDHSEEKINLWLESAEATITNYLISYPSNLYKAHYHINYKQSNLPNKEHLKSSKIITVQSGDNVGFAAANNIGIKLGFEIGASLFWILNNDTIVQSDSLSLLIDCFDKQQNNQLGILGSQLRYYPEKGIVQSLGGRYIAALGLTKHIGDGLKKEELEIAEIFYESDYAVGASMLVSADFINEVGLMNEEYFLYFEELDWHLRGKKLGWQHAICTKSIVYHKEGASIGSGKGKVRSDLSDFYYLRNKIIFTRKFYTMYLPLIYISFIGIVFNRIRRRQFRKAINIVKLLLKV